MRVPHSEVAGPDVHHPQMTDWGHKLISIIQRNLAVNEIDLASSPVERRYFGSCRRSKMRELTYCRVRSRLYGVDSAIFNTARAVTRQGVSSLQSSHLMA